MNIATAVRRLSEAVDEGHAGMAEVNVSCSELHGAALTLLDALPEMRRQAHAAAWSEGYSAGYLDAEAETAFATHNPYRKDGNDG